MNRHCCRQWWEEKKQGDEDKKTSRAQEKNSGKFKFFVKKNYKENFQRAVQVVRLKGEVRFFLKIGECSQDHSVKCPSLFVSLGRFPHDFCGASQLPALPGEDFTFS